MAGCENRERLISAPEITTPVVSSTSPGNISKGVSLNSKISATFSETMDSLTVTSSTFILKQGEVSVVGVVSYFGTTATFSPLNNLMSNTTYTATITTGTKGLSGKPLANSYSWVFTTGVQYSVTLSSNVIAGGTISGGGFFNLDSSVTVVAKAVAGYKFTSWKEDGIEVSQNASYTFSINKNRSLTANFEIGNGGLLVNLGTAARFAILSNSTITNIPTSAVTGDVGLSPGVRSSIAGLTNPEVNGTIFTADDEVSTQAMLIAAKHDAEVAYLDAVAAVRGTPAPISGNVNGLTLVPGLYESGTSIELSPGGILYLDAMGDVNGVFVIRSATSITTSATSDVILTNGAKAANVFWSAGSSVTLGTNSKMKGTIIASTSISILTGARLDGRALIQGAAAGQVSLDQCIIVKP
jgi:hypothetical protein